MRHYNQEWIEEWCADNGWTEVFLERPGHYWAFPPGAVMPEPIPSDILQLIKDNKGWCREERWLVLGTMGGAIASFILTYFLRCPLPLVFAFALGAVTTSLLEIE